MYDIPFIFDECGFTDLPPEIERERLFNVSLDLHTGDIKLYVLDRSERFLYKISRDGITRQYSGDDPEHGAQPKRLNVFLGFEFDSNEIVIDAVEDDTYYVYLDDARMSQSRHFYAAICRVYGVSDKQLMRSINAVAGRPYTDINNVIAHKAISLVKVPLSGQDAKVYARPFLHGLGFELEGGVISFLTRLYACDEVVLSEKLKFAWVATEIKSDRRLVVTQNHALLHKD
jgi:hypothetical protein